MERQCATPALPVLSGKDGVKVVSCADKTEVAVGEKVTFMVWLRNPKALRSERLGVALDLTKALDDGQVAGPVKLHVARTTTATVREGDGAAALDRAIDLGSVTRGQYSWAGRVAAGRYVGLSEEVVAKAGGDGWMESVITIAPQANQRGGVSLRTRVRVVSSSISTSTTYTNLWPGSKVSYAVRTNRGSRIRIDLTDVLDDARLVGRPTATTGRVTRLASSKVVKKGDTLFWTGIAPVTIRFTVQIRGFGSGDRSMVSRAYLVSSSGTGASSTTTLLLPGLIVSKVASLVQVPVGGRVLYQLTIKNPEDGPTGGVKVVDHMADVLDQAIYLRDGRATSGTVGFSGSKLTWSGSVPAQGSVRVTYSVRVRRLGDRQLLNYVTSSQGNCVHPGDDDRCSELVTVVRRGGPIIPSDHDIRPVLPHTGSNTAAFAFMGGSVLTGLGGAAIFGTRRRRR